MSWGWVERDRLGLRRCCFRLMLGGSRGTYCRAWTGEEAAGRPACFRLEPLASWRKHLAFAKSFSY